MIIANTAQGQALNLLPQLANRHGLITGATGSGKTVTLRRMVEQFSRLGIPCFIPDIKMELSGLATANPVVFYDLYGELGQPIRTTVQNLGDLLLSRLLDLNKVQSGIITLLFKVCEDNNLYNLDLFSIKKGLTYLADNAFDFKREYGNITYSSVGAIQREILGLQKQGVNQLFNKPVFDIQELFRINEQKQGVINILQADTLIKSPKLYITFLLWLLSELYERLPEVGDLDKPKFVFFFDEAHLLFKDCPAVLLNKIEQIIRLIRSKGVGVYFVTQSALDIPESVLGQLGNRVQHALRAFTPRDRKTVKAIAETFRDNPAFKTSKAITELKTGEALISFLQEDGDPGMVERGKVVLPESDLKPLEESQIREIVRSYNYTPDEVIKEETIIKIGENNNRRGVSRMVETFGRGVVRSMGNRFGNQVVRGIFNSFSKGTRGGLGK
jgi:uncharacterized protein